MAARSSSSPAKAPGDSTSASTTSNVESASRGKSKPATPDTSSVVDAVEMLQQRKLKPDQGRIATYIEKHWPAAFNQDPSIVGTLIVEALSRALIVSVNNLDVISFRTPSKIGRMLRVTKILPFEGEPPLIVVHEVMLAAGVIEAAAADSTDQYPQGAGVTAEELVGYLHSKLRLLNYNAQLLNEKVFPAAVQQGYAQLLSKHDRITLTDSFRRLNNIQLLPPGSTFTGGDSTVETSNRPPEKKKKLVGRPKKRDSNGSNKSIDKSSDSESSGFGSAIRRRHDESMLDLNDIEEMDKEIDMDEEREVANEDSKHAEAKDASNVPQRVSTRKRFKKSLGPDFVDSSDQLMYYIKEPNAGAKCCLCNGAFTKLKPPTILGRKSKTNEVITETNVQCSKCEIKVHTQCLGLSELVGLKYQWKCASCGICSQCNVKQNKRKQEFIISCRTCKRGFHTTCTTFHPSRDMPSNSSAKCPEWDCPKCSTPRVETSTAKSGNSSKAMTSLLNKNSKHTPTVSTGASSSSDSKFRTLLPKTSATTTSTAKPLCTKVNSQPVYVMKPNTSLLSKSNDTPAPASNSLLMPVSSGQLTTKVNRNTGNIVLSNVIDKQKSIETKASLIDHHVKTPAAARGIHEKVRPDVEKKHPTEPEASTSNGNNADKKTTTPKQQNIKVKSIEKPTTVKIELKKEPIDEVSVISQPANKVAEAKKRRAFPNFKTLLDCSSPLEMKQNFIAWINCELKHLVKCNPVPLYSLPDKVNQWKPKDVHVFMDTIGFRRTADILLENQVDGVALLLMRRKDIIQRLSLKIGPALKLYALLSRLREEFDINA